MSIDNIEDLTPRVQYTAAAGQTEFAYPFPIFAEGDLVIDVDGTIQVITTDYTVDGVGEDLGGTVTLLNACTGGETVTLWRDTEIFRTTDVPQNGGWSSRAYNDEMDRFTAILQEVRDATQRALRLPRTTAALAAQTELDRTTWANKYVTIGPDGLPTPAALSATTMTAFTIGALVSPVTDEEALESIDPDTRYGYGDPRRYGAKFDNATDDTDAIQLTLDMAANYPLSKHARVQFPCGATRVTQITVWGAGIVVLFDAAVISGIATSAKTSVVQIKCGHSFLRGLKATANRNDYYASVAHWYTNDLDTHYPGRNTIIGMNLQSGKIGLAVGALPSQSFPMPSQGTVRADGTATDAPLSENNVMGVTTYDCVVGASIRQTNGKLTLLDSVLVGEINNWTGYATPEDCCGLVIEGSEVTLPGGSLEQNSEDTGTLARVKNGTLNVGGTTVESVAPIWIEGTSAVRIGQLQNWGLNTSSSPFFLVKDDSTGELILHSTFLQRAAGYSGSQPVLKCVDSLAVRSYSPANKFQVRAYGTEFRDANWTQGATYNTMIAGCQFTPIDCWMSVYSGTTRTARYPLHAGRDLLPEVADSSFSTVSAYPQTTSTTSAGWTFAVSNGSQQWGSGSTSLPTIEGYQFVKYLQLTSTSGQNVSAASAKMKVTPGSVKFIPMFVKGDGSAHKFLVRCRFYDFGGANSASPTADVFSGNLTAMPSNSWHPTGFWAQVPADATQMDLLLYTEDGGSVKVLLPRVH